MNDDTFYKIRLDLVHNTINNFVHVMQYDDGVAYIRAEIYKNWQLVHPNSEFDAAQLRIKKPNGGWIKCSTGDPYIQTKKPTYQVAVESGSYYYLSEGTTYIQITSSMTEQAYSELDERDIYKNIGDVISLENDYVKINIVSELTDTYGGCPAVIDLYSSEGHIQTARFVLDVDMNPIQQCETVTSVPVDVEYELERLKNKKLNKDETTGSNRVYGVNVNGEQEMYIIAQTYPRPNRLVQRTNNGTVVTGTPINATDAVNKEYFDDAIEELGSATNLENGEGTDSLKQKISLEPEYELTEDTSIVEGKTYYTRSGVEGSYVYTEVQNPIDSELSTYYELFDYQNVVSGNRSVAFGNSNKITKGDSGAIGEHNEVSGGNSVALAYYNKVSGDGAVAGGEYNEVSGESAVAMGYKGKASGASSFTANNNNKAQGYASTAFGLNNEANAAQTFTAGQENKTKTQRGFTAGWKNTNNGDTATMFGQENETGSLATFTVGRRNKNKAMLSFVGGQDSESNTAGAFVHGNGLDATGENWKGVIGRFNAPKTNTLFEVGNGWENSSSGRKNSFEVYTDGHAEVQTQGMTPKSVVTKEYFDAHSEGGTALYRHDVMMQTTGYKVQLSFLSPYSSAIEDSDLFETHAPMVMPGVYITDNYEFGNVTVYIFSNHIQIMGRNVTTGEDIFIYDDVSSYSYQDTYIEL